MGMHEKVRQWLITSKPFSGLRGKQSEKALSGRRRHLGGGLIFNIGNFLQYD